MNSDTKLGLGCGAFAVGIIALVIFLWNCWTTIPSGHVGILTTFGKVNDEQIGEGFNMVVPWKAIHKMSVRTQEDREAADVPTKDGLSVHLEVSLLYSLKPDQAPKVYRQYGEEYQTIAVTPQFRSVLRNATAHFNASDLYTASREKIESGLLTALRNTMKEEGIVVEAVLLKDVQLPGTVKKAIERKLAMEQEAQQMIYTIKKEELEADRKRTEAHGIADAQKIIQGTLTEAYLKYLYIIQLEKNKSNREIIYIPTEGGIPILEAGKGVNKK